MILTVIRNSVISKLYMRNKKLLFSSVLINETIGITVNKSAECGCECV